MSKTTERDPQGRFPAGKTGNPAGRPRGATPAKTLQKLLAADGAQLIERAFVRAHDSDVVLASVVNLIAAAEVATVLAGAMAKAKLD